MTTLGASIATESNRAVYVCFHLDRPGHQLDAASTRLAQTPPLDLPFCRMKKLCPLAMPASA